MAIKPACIAALAKDFTPHPAGFWSVWHKIRGKTALLTRRKEKWRASSPYEASLKKRHFQSLPALLEQAFYYPLSFAQA